VAVLYAEGFVVDEDTDPRARPDPLPYADLMEQAMAYFDASLALAENATWTLPQEWMQAPINARELARATHALEARYQAAGARTPAERAALDWDAILADVDAGIAADLVLYMDDDHGWSNDALGYGTYPTWSQLGFFVYGMADQSGSYQLWNARPLPEKNPVLDGRPMLIVTPDLRFPQGSTVEEQSAAPGRYFRIRNESAAEAYTWSAPHRGTWRWSWYKHARGGSYWDDHAYLQPEIRMEEMRLLRAEGLYRRGDLAGAAALVNETRVAAGLSPTDASGANASCVPRLPDGRCGDLWEMLKWEKRMETVWTGVAMGNWFFDGRGWGDLYVNTPLQYPVPCQELQVLQLLPCNTYGGPGGEFSAPGSTYAYPHET
jgi:hypothetical protein